LNLSNDNLQTTLLFFYQFLSPEVLPFKHIPTAAQLLFSSAARPSRILYNLSPPPAQTSCVVTSPITLLQSASPLLHTPSCAQPLLAVSWGWEILLAFTMGESRRHIINYTHKPTPDSAKLNQPGP